MEAAVRQKVLIDVVLPEIGADSRAMRLARDAVLVVGFALFMTVLAQIAIRLPNTTVPITAHTFGALLTGGSLGSKRGALSMLVFNLFGMLSIPAFSPPESFMKDKTIHFILPWAGKDGAVWDLANGGYIVGFILAAYLVGRLAERGWDRRSTVPLAMVAGNVAVYIIGLPWLAYYIAYENVPGMDLTYYDAIVGNSVLDKTFKGGLFPYIGGDAVKLLAAAMVLPGAWAVVNKVKGVPRRD